MPPHLNIHSGAIPGSPSAMFYPGECSLIWFQDAWRGFKTQFKLRSVQAIWHQSPRQFVALAHRSQFQDFTSINSSHAPNFYVTIFGSPPKLIL
jgi:hypothetical protein